MFLTKAQIAQLTGRQKAAAQRRALDKLKIRYTEDIDGWPVVLCASVERKILGQALSAEPARGPDFSAFPQLS